MRGGSSAGTLAPLSGRLFSRPDESRWGSAHLPRLASMGCPTGVTVGERFDEPDSRTRVLRSSDPMGFRRGEMNGEEDFSAQGAPAGPAPRIPPPDGDQGRSRDRLGPATSGPSEALGLTLGRLHHRGDFTALERTGRRGRAGLVRVTCLPDEGTCVRVAFGTTGIRSAVARNRRRRQLRAVVRDLARRSGGASEELLPGRYLVVVAAGNASYPELEQWVRDALQRALR